MTPRVRVCEGGGPDGGLECEGHGIRCLATKVAGLVRVGHSRVPRRCRGGGWVLAWMTVVADGGLAARPE